MSWYKLFYLFTILDRLSTTFNIIMMLSTFGFVMFTIIYFSNKNRLTNIYYCEAGKHWLNVIKWPYRTTICLLIVSWSLIILTPTRKDMIIIIAGGAVGEFIIGDSSAQKLPADITRFLRGEILKATAELNDEAKHSIGVESEADRIKNLSKEELEKLVLENLNEKKAN